MTALRSCLHALLLRGLLFAALASLPAAAPAVVGGVIDDNRPDSPYAGVGSLLRSGNEVYSAVLIAPQYALTAAHVVERGLFPRSFSFNLNTEGDRSFTTDVEEIFIHPAYRGFKADSDGLVRDDIAILRLEQPAPAGTPIYRLYEGGLSAGQRISFVGYGAAESGTGDWLLPAPSVKRRGESRIDALPAKAGEEADPDVYVFRSLPMLDAPAAGLAFGDSGGPSFVEDEDGSLALLGINTFALRLSASHPHSFVAGGGGVLLPAHATWIRSVTEQQQPPPAAWARVSTAAMLLSGLIALGWSIRRMLLAGT